ncbi:hypothetical protein C8R45DRAFT_1098106 [Mycena sanguinolenta]|nr:hypothetical protein C8R45DRAFT_1098106 [Mycena sanguinolenta]
MDPQFVASSGRRVDEKRERERDCGRFAPTRAYLERDEVCASSSYALLSPDDPNSSTYTYASEEEEHVSLSANLQFFENLEMFKVWRPVEFKLRYEVYQDGFSISDVRDATLLRGRHERAHASSRHPFCFPAACNSFWKRQAVNDGAAPRDYAGAGHRSRWSRPPHRAPLSWNSPKQIGITLASSASLQPMARTASTSVPSAEVLTPPCHAMPPADESKDDPSSLDLDPLPDSCLHADEDDLESYDRFRIS